MNAVRWIKQFARKKSRQSLSRLPYLKETFAVWHRRCHWISNANSSPLDRFNRFCLIFPQAVVPNNCAVLKNWSDDGGIPNSKSVSGKTSTLKPFEFEVVQASIRSGAGRSPCAVLEARHLAHWFRCRTFSPSRTFPLVTTT